MLKKRMVMFLLLFWTLVSAYSQAKPRLGILPFTGGDGGDGETIATLFSFQSDIQKTFTVVPRTSAVNALVAEQNFQMVGYTDSDTIAQLGRLLNADFVVSGHIRRLGSSSLVIATIVNVETFEQMAGDYRQYRTIEEVRGLLPGVAQKLIAATQRDTSQLPKLAIAPFNVANKEVNAQDAEVLAQILSIEVTNIGKYAVLPRTATMQTALQELEYQAQGYTAEESAKALGRAINAGYVLAAEARSLGSINMFTAQILHVEDGSLLTGEMKEYKVVDDGIKLMAELALLLTDKAAAEKNRAEAVDFIMVEPPRTEQVQPKQKSPQQKSIENKRFNSFGVSIGSSFADPWLIGMVHGTIAPFNYSFLEIGCDFGFVSRFRDVGYFSIYPFARYAFFLPFAKNSGWYIGLGAGYMFAQYTYEELKISKKIFVVDTGMGVNLGNFTIDYSLRTDFASLTVSNKISIGYVYRF